MLYDWSKNLQLLALPLLTLSQPPTGYNSRNDFFMHDHALQSYPILQFLLWFENWMQDQGGLIMKLLEYVCWSDNIFTTSLLCESHPEVLLHQAYPVHLNLLLLEVEPEKAVSWWKQGSLQLQTLIWEEASSEELVNNVNNSRPGTILHKSKAEFVGNWTQSAVLSTNRSQSKSSWQGEAGWPPSCPT